MKFFWPIKDVDPAKIPTGYRFAVNRGSVTHPGLDMGKGGETVYAAAPGIVSAAGWAASGEGGVLVYVDHDRHYQTRYFHMKPTLAVKRGDRISAGDKIGIADSTGIKNSPPHLHFEIRYKKPTEATATKPPRDCTLLSSDGSWYLCNPEKLLKYAVPIGLVLAAIAAGYLLLRG